VQSEFRYPTPTASPFADIGQYVPLLLTAIDAALDRRDVWPDSDVDTALGYVEDLKAWVMDNLGVRLPAGAILPYAGATAPDGYLVCDGSAVSRTTYADLFAAIGTSYGVGNGSSTFNLPDLRGRTVIGVGQGSGLANRTLAQTGGEESHVLSVAEMPNHRHAIGADSGGSGNDSSGTYRAGNDWLRYTQYAGSSQAHNTMPPFIVLSYLIKA